MSEIETARRFWDREVADPTNNSWMAHPLVREYINRSISGPEGGWPLDWFQKRFSGRTFRHGLSIGCGAGALERDVLTRGICETMDAIDASSVSLAVARDEAQRVGLEQQINYFAGDFNTLQIRRKSYDIVFFHQSLHHVSRLERLLKEVRRALRPGGLVYLDEFIGPSRTYWNDQRIAWYRALYQFIPRGMRYFEEFAMPIQYEDLSEAIRSGEIISRLDIGFRRLEVRGYGGNVLAMMFPDIDVRVVPDELVAMLIRAEESLLASGPQPFHAIVIAEPKRGYQALVADLRYLVAPKVNRVLRELGGAIRRESRHAPEEDRFRV